jgi:long-chain acyl-CoA synthetase
MKTINQLFEESVNKYSNNTFMLEKNGSEYQLFSYKNIQEQVYNFASGLIKMGLKKGDRVALLAEGRNRWLISELGVLHAGGVSVPLSVKLGDASEIMFRLEHSGTKFLIVSGNQAPKVKKLKNELNDLEKVIHLDEPESTEKKDIYFGDIVEMGTKSLQNDPSNFEKTWRGITGEDYATICYTSGTTSDPKGIILSHRNYTANVEQSLTLFDVPEWYRSLIILPWDHAFAHTVGLYTLMSCGGSIASVQVGKTTLETLKNIPVNIKETKPHFLLSVPALAKNFRKNIEKAISEKGKVAAGLFNRGLSVAYRYNGNGHNRGKGFRKFYGPMYKLYDKVLFSKIRENFGGNLQFFVGGGALLDIELQRFFYAIGIPMYQGYGLTEASPVISSNNPDVHKMGSSGILVDNIKVKICDEDGKEVATGEKGEIVVKGENVMVGYWNNKEATEETIVDGWLHTGDMGYLDNEGFLYVLGRFKSLLIADDGEKYSPEGMEEAFINQSVFIDQCMLYNNQNPYTVALIVPNKEAVKRWVNEEDLIPGSEQAEIAVCKLFESELNEYRIGRKHEKLFPQRWLPAATAILEEGFTEDNHLMNSTLKVVRGKVEEKYQHTLEFLYMPEGKDICNDHNRKTVREIFVE